MQVTTGSFKESTSSLDWIGAYNMWDKVFNNGPSEICGRQPLKNLKRYGMLKQTISLQIF